MANYENQPRYGATVAQSGAEAVDQGLRAYMLRVYNYMTIGLVLTGVTAWAVVNTSLINLFFQQSETGFGLTLLGWVAFLAPLALVFVFSFGIQRMSVATAQLLFWVYAALMGVSLSPILLLYTGASVSRTFFITAATFGAMSLWGYTTSRDLTGMGRFLIMGVIGIIIASIVNIFLGSAAVDFAISIIGVLAFTGLTAYDTQKVKEMYFVGDDGTVAGRKAIMGALNLYLDFVNLFLFLLRLFGSSRN
ncbi:MAG TPA: Bax inhibitor-1/YccA family protein [Bauldia sp.]|nr:Bax inhibitor-1/YccA family protein [Bauldia sp.]